MGYVKQGIGTVKAGVTDATDYVSKNPLNVLLGATVGVLVITLGFVFTRGRGTNPNATTNSSPSSSALPSATSHASTATAATSVSSAPTSSSAPPTDHTPGAASISVVTAAPPASTDAPLSTNSTSGIPTATTTTIVDTGAPTVAQPTPTSATPSTAIVTTTTSGDRVSGDKASLTTATATPATTTSTTSSSSSSSTYITPATQPGTGARPSVRFSSGTRDSASKTAAEQAKADVEHWLFSNEIPAIALLVQEFNDHPNEAPDIPSLMLLSFCALSRENVHQVFESYSSEHEHTRSLLPRLVNLTKIPADQRNSGNMRKRDVGILNNLKGRVVNLRLLFKQPYDGEPAPLYLPLQNKRFVMPLQKLANTLSAPGSASTKRPG